MTLLYRGSKYDRHSALVNGEIEAMLGKYRGHHCSYLHLKTKRSAHSSPKLTYRGVAY